MTNREKIRKIGTWTLLPLGILTSGYLGSRPDTPRRAETRVNDSTIERIATGIHIPQTPTLQPTITYHQVPKEIVDYWQRRNSPKNLEEPSQEEMSRKIREFNQKVEVEQKAEFQTRKIASHEGIIAYEIGNQVDFIYQGIKKSPAEMREMLNNKEVIFEEAPKIEFRYALFKDLLIKYSTNPPRGYSSDKFEKLIATFCLKEGGLGFPDGKPKYDDSRLTGYKIQKDGNGGGVSDAEYQIFGTSDTMRDAINGTHAMYDGARDLGDILETYVSGSQNTSEGIKYAEDFLNLKRDFERRTRSF